jgi:hypothetical protein
LSQVRIRYKLIFVRSQQGGISLSRVIILEDLAALERALAVSGKPVLIFKHSST